MSKSIIQKIIAISLMLSLLAIMPMVFKIGMANAYYLKSQYYLDQWIEDESSITQFEFDDALDAAKTSVKFDQKNPDYLIRLAKIQEWGWFSGFFEVEQVKLDELYQQAINLRPKYAHGYVFYAYSLAFIKQDTDNAFEYLQKAEKLAPFDEMVQQNLVMIGDANWQKINFKQKSSVFLAALKMLDTDVKQSFHYVENIILLSEQREYYCLYFANHEKDMSERAIRRYQQKMCE